MYYLPQPLSPEDFAIMRRIDRLHLTHPFMGARMLRDTLRGEGVFIGRKHVATLMRRMGIEPLYRRPNTSKKHPAHAVYPYLLRTMTIERANQVWAMDITYIPMARGFVYLAAIVDWASRRVLTHRVSISMDTEFVWRRCRRPLHGTEPPRSSTPTREASSPAKRSAARCWSMASALAWMAKELGAITCSWSGCGAA